VGRPSCHTAAVTDSAITRATAEHYVWGAACDGWRLVDQPGLSVIEERVPPGAGEVSHRHAVARQFFYLLSGRAEMRTPQGATELTPGAGVEIPPGLPHQFLNTGPADAVFLVISAPNTKTDRHPI
jgi:mannose-6-phosphate isomerase-like protein (cupin superfamily)